MVTQICNNQRKQFWNVPAVEEAVYGGLRCVVVGGRKLMWRYHF